MAWLEKCADVQDEILRFERVLAEPLLFFGWPEVRADRTRFTEYGALDGRQRLKKLSRTWRRARRRVFGQTAIPKDLPDWYRYPDLVEALAARGIKDVDVLDLFDPRADLRHDMNHPLTPDRRYATLIDIGSLEHVFDTKQCLENCFRLVQPGGTYVLGTPVKGWFAHGLHTFNPETLIGALRANGFEVLLERYTDNRGFTISNPDAPDAPEDLFIWLVARKGEDRADFVAPQQGMWNHHYDGVERSG